MMKNILLLNTLRCVVKGDKRFQMIQNFSSFATMKQNFYLQKSCSSSLDSKHANMLQKVSVRHFITSSINFQNEDDNREVKKPKKAIDPAKDRSKNIPPEVSIRYLKSKAYQTTYGDNPVWLRYRRNQKGPYPLKVTRKKCIEQNVIATASPCPICRDEYLIIHYTNTDLLKQFISPYTGEILQPKKTGVCQVKQLALEVAIEQAKYYGLITFDIPFRAYNYEEFYPQLKIQKLYHGNLYPSHLTYWNKDNE